MLLSRFTAPDNVAWVGAPGVRARVRAELTREIAEVARRHLASDGAAALSLRAVARELGMASSAVYRYFPSRDDLLTALIVDAYDAMGEAAESADANRDRGPIFSAVGRRHARPFGDGHWPIRTSTPSFTALQSRATRHRKRPSDLRAAWRVVLCRVVADGIAYGAVDVTSDGSGMDATIQPGLAGELGLPADPTGSVAARVVHAWTSLFGLINFELFGHTHNVVIDDEAFFSASTARLAAQLGVVEGAAR